MNALTAPRKKLPPCLLREMNTLWIQANSRKQKRGCWKTPATRWFCVAGRRPVMDLCCDGAPRTFHHSRTVLKTEEARVAQPPSAAGRRSALCHLLVRVFTGFLRL